MRGAKWTGLVAGITTAAILLAACGGNGAAGTPPPAAPSALATGTPSAPVAVGTATRATGAAPPSATATTLATPMSPPSNVAAANVQTVISGFAFAPLTVARGAAVTWVNRDPTDHDVTALDGMFASPPLHEGGTFTARFDRPGTYVYRCTIHPFMTASVIVQ